MIYLPTVRLSNLFCATTLTIFGYFNFPEENFVTASKTNLTEQNIRDLSEAKVFERGYQYFAEGRAKIVSENKGSIHAVVDGTQEYVVRLKHTSRQFDASCDCPAARGFDFCKHCVAASLAYLESLFHKESLKQRSGDDLLNAYLLGLPREQLVAALSDHIRRNPITLQNWMLKAETAAEKLDARSLKKHITAAIPYNRHLHSYPQARAFFQKIEALLDRLQIELNHLDADEALKLVDYAIFRIRRALETVDDSGGFRYPSLESLADLHRLAIQSSQRTEDQKAEYLLQIYLGENIDFYPAIPDSYLDILDPRTLSTFYQRLHQRWETLPTLEPGNDDERHFDRKLDYLHTLAPLLNKARQEGNVELEIRYLEKCATSVRDMIALSALNAESNNLKDANLWLQRAESVSSKSGFRADRSSIIKQKVELLILEKNPDSAIQVQWNHFLETKDRDGYLQLKNLARRIDNKEDWYAKSVALLESSGTPPNTDFPAETLVQIHIEESQTLLAIEIAKKYPLPPELLTDVVRNPQSVLEHTLPLIDRVFEFHVSRKNLPGYEAAVKFIEEIYNSKKKREQRLLEKFVIEKAEMHKPKTNLLKLLGKTWKLD